MKRAKSSFPTPLCPFIITLASVTAAFLAVFKRASSTGELPKNALLFGSSSLGFSMIFTALLAGFSSRTFLSTATRASASKGLVRKSLTPRRKLSIAPLRVALPVMITISYFPASSLAKASPSIPGIFISVTTISVSSGIFFSASRADLKHFISNSSYSLSANSKDLRIFISSSTMLTLVLALTFYPYWLILARIVAPCALKIAMK